MGIAIDRLSNTWKSDLSDKIKRDFFKAVAVSILVCGCTTWTLQKHWEKKLDKNYTRMLRVVLDKSSKQHPTKQQFYRHSLPISKTIQVRWTRLARRYWKSKNEFISDIPLRTPLCGHASVDRPTKTFIDRLCADTECSLEDLLETMDDRNRWWEKSMLSTWLDYDDNDILTGFVRTLNAV